MTDRELMVAAYKLATQIQNLQHKLNAVQSEIDRRVKDEIQKEDVKEYNSRDNAGDSLD
jgi:predicted Holliday junction resolvase-like endonuclease